MAAHRVGTEMLLGAVGIEMAAGTDSGRHLSLLLARCAARFGMQMETMLSRRKALQVRFQYQPARGVLQGDGADRCAGTFGGDQIHRNGLCICGKRLKAGGGKEEGERGG